MEEEKRVKKSGGETTGPKSLKILFSKMALRTKPTKNLRYGFKISSNLAQKLHPQPQDLVSSNGSLSLMLPSQAMMTTMPYNPQGGNIEVSVSLVPQISSKWNNNNNNKIDRTITNNNRFSNNNSRSNSSKSSVCCSIDSSEPSSILDTRRSPSSPTSSSALSSAAPGVAAATTATTVGLVGLSEANPNSNSNTDTPIQFPEPLSGGQRKEDWEAELQNLHNGSDINSGCSVGGGEGEGLGMGDFESMFQVGDGSLVPWLVGEAEELGGLGFKHLMPSPGNPLDYMGGGGGGGIRDVESGSGEGSLLAALSSNLGFSGSGFLHTGIVGSVMPSCSSGGGADCKVWYNATAGLIANANIQSGSLFSPSMNNNANPVSLQPGVMLHQLDAGDEKHRIFSPQLLINQQQPHTIQSSIMLSPSLGYCELEQNVAQPQAKQHNPGASLDYNMGRSLFNHPGASLDYNMGRGLFLDQGHEFPIRKRFEMQQQFPVALGQQGASQQKQMMVSKQKVVSMGNEMVQQHYQSQQHHQQLQEQVARDLLHKVVDLIQSGNFSHAQEILARLNHQQHPAPTKPLIRVALCVKEALQLLLLMSNPAAIPPPKCLSPVDIVHKMNAYKVFSEVSPFMHFVNFTTTQAILEELEDAESIHIMDFDIGCGAKWASFIQELPSRKLRARSLKITAFATFSTYHQLELALMHENLTQFANDVGILLELQIVNFDTFDPSNSSIPNFRTSGNESIAVYFPVWASSSRSYLSQPLLRFIRQHAPKIMVSMDRGCYRCDLSFSQHLLHALDSCTNLLESLDSPSVPSEVVDKIEKFFVQPAIENALLGCLHVQDKVPPWKNIFAASGFSSWSFSNLTETQADYVLKRTPGRGFRVDKRQASLVLSWQGRELVAASAWKC
ncbi:Scarecrow-like protein [Drosera capensis]